MVPQSPLLPALLFGLDSAQSSPTTIMSTLIPSDLANSTALPKLRRSPKQNFILAKI